MTEETQNAVAEVVEESPPEAKPSVLSRIGRILFRILVTVVVGLALGTGLYFGAIRLYRDTIEPIQSYEQRISDLELGMAQLRSELESESEALNERQAAIEGRLATNAEALASVEALVAAAQDDLREQRRILATVENLEEDFESFTLALGDLSLLVEQLEAEIDSGDLPAARVQRTAVYLRGMTMLMRAQLEIDRTNLGFAAEQVALARDTMGELVSDESEPEDLYGDEELIGEIIERLGIVLADLPSRPEVASAQLEAIWNLFTEALQPVQLDPLDTGGE